MAETSKITNFFKRARPAPEISSESECEEASEVQMDIKNFQKLLRKKSEFYKKTKIELAKKSATGSYAWDYFGQLMCAKKNLLPKLNMCKPCYENDPLILKGFAKTTSTANLANHLRFTHNIDIPSKYSEISNKKTKSTLSGNEGLLNHSKSQKFANTRLLVQMCCRDLRPFNMVEQPGFLEYMQHIKPGLVMPTATTLSRSALNDVFLTYEQAIKQHIEASPEHIALVLDMWTDSFKMLSYVNIRAHYIVDFDPICISLTTEQFPHPHNKFTIAQKLTEIVEYFKLNGKEISYVSDEGTNIIAALRLMKKKRFGCSIHSLHRLISHDILENKNFVVFQSTTKKLKAIFKTLTYKTEHINVLQKSYEDQEIFNEIVKIVEEVEAENQITFEIDEIKSNQMGSLKNSNNTRWNTLCHMYRSFIKNKNIINIALIEADKEENALNTMEKELIAEFLNFLEIFESATKFLQGRKYTTLNLVIIYYQKIITDLKKKAPVVTFEEVIQIYMYAITRFRVRFKILKIHVIASLLDPSQKNWPVLEKWIKKIPTYYVELDYELNEESPDFESSRKYNVLNMEITKRFLADDDGPSTSQAVTTQRVRNTARAEMLSFIASTSNVVVYNHLESEIKKYFDTELDDDTDTFGWWKKNGHNFPSLAKLAIIILSIPATSASSEEAFSSAGALINAKRSSLNPCTVKKVLFIHDNYNIFQNILKNK